MVDRRVRRRVATVVLTAGGLALAGCNLGVAPVTYDVPSRDLAAGDIDGDGDVDLLAGGFDGLAILVNQGDGQLAPTTVATAPIFVVELLDVDRDGALDLVAVVERYVTPEEPHAFVQVHPGGGDGSFAEAPSWESDLGFQTSVNDLVTADVDGDGTSDLLLAETLSPSGSCSVRGVSLFLGDGAGGFAAAPSPDFGRFASTALAPADVDGDGDVDIVGSGSMPPSDPMKLCEDPALVVMRQTGSGSFTVERHAIDPAPQAPASGVVARDFDGDGLVDAAATSHGRLAVFLGQPGGTFADPTSLSSDRWLQTAADIDRDGIVDLVLGADADGAGRVVYGDGAGSFVDPHLVDSGLDGGHGDVVAVDLDADGRDDLAFAGSGVGVLMNRLDGRGH